MKPIFSKYQFSLPAAPLRNDGGTRAGGSCPTGGSGSPLRAKSHKCPARINSSVLNFPSLSTSARPQIWARIFWGNPLCSSK